MSLSSNYLCCLTIFLQDKNTTREPISNSTPHEDPATDLPAGIRHLCILKIIMSSANYAPNI
jgi:hypothetical protein